MKSKNPRPLADRVIEAAEAALAAQDYVSAADVLVGIRWVDGGTVKRWRQGQVDCLESAIQTSPQRITEAMALLRSWAAERGLLPSETPYVARTSQRPALRFSKSGDPGVEQLYRTHWVSRKLLEKQNAAGPHVLIIVRTEAGGADRSVVVRGV